MKVLIVGFERWGSYSTNPSQYVAEKLDGKKIAGAKIKGVVLPVNFKTLPKTLHHAIKKYRPDILITLGLAFRNMDKITLETVAKRKIKPFFPDNYGRWPNGTNKPRLYDVIGKEKGPFFRKSKLPLKNIISKLKKANIPLSVSQKAGGHMCEQVFYLGQHFMEKEKLDGISGHIHLPHSPLNGKEVKSKEFMKLNKILKAIKISIKESVIFLNKNNR